VDKNIIKINWLRIYRERKGINMSEQLTIDIVSDVV